MEKVICALINGLPQIHHHEILTLDSNQEAKRWLQNQNVHFVDFRRPAGTIPYLVALFKVLRQEMPDVLMTYNWGATDAIWLGRLARIPIIFHNEHGFNVEEARHILWKRNIIRFIVYRLAKKVIVVSQALYLSLKHSYGLADQRVAFILNGIDTTLYSSDPQESMRVRKKFGLGEEHFVIGFSGRLDSVKNFELLLQVFEICVKEDRGIRLVLVGDGSEKKRIETICRQKGLQDHALFIGQTDNVLPYLRIFDVILLTSFSEQMPMSILEAMAVGMPVVASRVGEIPHMVEDGKEGFLCELDDLPQHWAMRLLSLKNIERRRAMGTTARNTVMDRFQEKAMIASYHHLMSGELLNDNDH